jgi:hypothetical protein
MNATSTTTNIKERTMSKLIGTIQKSGHSPVTRQDAQDLTVRISQATYTGTLIEADMIANGRGSVRIEHNSGAEKVLIMVDPATTKNLVIPTLEERVKVYVGNRYVSLSDIAAALTAIAE